MIEKNENCEDCPEYGFCENGKLIKCEKGWKLNSFAAICIKKENDTELVLNILNHIKNYLSYENTKEANA